MWQLNHKKDWAVKKWCFQIVVLEKTLESPLDFKEITPVNPKGNQPWTFKERLILKLKLQYLVTWCEELTHWKRPWCWERLRAGGEVGDRGWDGWLASLTQWTWVWVNAGRQWRTGKPGVLRFMDSQKVGDDWAIEQQGFQPSIQPAGRTVACHPH